MTRAKAERLVLNLTHLHVADVSGTGEFPIKLLTACQPFAIEDAHAIYATFLPGSRGRPYIVRIKKYAPGSVGWSDNYREFTRWHAEGCTVTPVNPSDPRPTVPDPRNDPGAYDSRGILFAAYPVYFASMATEIVGVAQGVRAGDRAVSIGTPYCIEVHAPDLYELSAVLKAAYDPELRWELTRVPDAARKPERVLWWRADHGKFPDLPIFFDATSYAGDSAEDIYALLKREPPAKEAQLSATSTIDARELTDDEMMTLPADEIVLTLDSSGENCPGCGSKPGDGVTADCNDPKGCGFYKTNIPGRSQPIK